MEAFDKLKQKLIADMRNSKDADQPYISNSTGSWTKNQVADEVEKGTEFGIDMLSGLIMLTLDLMSRGKAKMNEIKWRISENGKAGKYWFGEINGMCLFYIKDRNIGGGLDKYELEVKFLDRRWSSNNEDELKSVAKEQLHNLIEKLAG